MYSRLLSTWFDFDRYVGVILPREEGKASVETTPKKVKKTKALVRTGQVPY